MSSPMPALIAGILIIVVFSYLTKFTFLYQRRKASLFENIPSLFNCQLSWDVYLSLLHLDIACPVQIRQAALLERAKEDISRIHTLKKLQAAACKLSEKRVIA